MQASITRIALAPRAVWIVAQIAAVRRLSGWPFAQKLLLFLRGFKLFVNHALWFRQRLFLRFFRRLCRYRRFFFRFHFCLFFRRRFHCSCRFHSYRFFGKKYTVQFLVRPGDDMSGDNAPHSCRSGAASFYSRLDGAYVADHFDQDHAAAFCQFITYQFYVSRFYSCIRRRNGDRQANGFNHT